MQKKRAALKSSPLFLKFGEMQTVDVISSKTFVFKLNLFKKEKRV